MNDPISTAKLTNPVLQKRFFTLCWVAYFSTYIGRLNFTASLAQIARSDGFTLTALGMVSSGFFVGYGIFQLIWGALGDRWDPAKIVFSGVFFSGICNLAMTVSPAPAWMAVFWTVNGVVQSAVWSPLLRLTVDCLPSHEAMTYSVRYSTTVPVGTFAAYALSALCAALGSWRTVFVCAGAILLGISALWWRGMRRLSPAASRPRPRMTISSAPPARIPGVWRLLIPIAAAAAVNGLIRDALQTWMPSYLSQIHGAGSVSSIVLTLTLPIINLGGVYLGKQLNDRVFHREPLTACACMGLACAVLALALLGLPMGADLGIFGVCAALMLAVNTMLVTLIPMKLRSTGRVSALSGLLNAATYAGSTLSGFGVGGLLERSGWSAVVLGGCVCALTAAALCGIALIPWRKITQFHKLKGAIEP